MEWLIDNKLFVGKIVGNVFDWFEEKGVFFFDVLFDLFEVMIESFFWLL